MNVYHYIAESDPIKANELCKKYGYYQNQYIEDIPICLQQIVAEHGEPAFKEILALHPDKDVILEVFQTKEQPQQEPTMLQQPKQDCSCMMNADGTTNALSITSNTNTMILLAAIVISISIIAIKK